MSDTGKVKNISGEDLIDGWSGGRLVLDGQSIDVPLDRVFAYTWQAERWAPADAAAKKAHKEGSEPAAAETPAEPSADEPASAGSDDSQEG